MSDKPDTRKGQPPTAPTTPKGTETGTPEPGSPDAAKPDTEQPQASTPETGTPPASIPQANTPQTGPPETGTPETGRSAHPSSRAGATGAHRASLFFCHGMWSTGACFDMLAGDLRALGYRCHAPTLPGHDVDPACPPPEGLGRLSMTDYVDALEAEMRAFDPRAIIVGHSMGGLLAQLLAARGLGRGLILLAPAPMAGANTTHPSPSAIFLPHLARWGFWRRPHKPGWGRVRWGVFNGVPEDEARAWYNAYVWESGRALAELAFWWADPGRATRVDTARVTGPVHIFAGRRDRITPLGFARHTARAYGDRATLTVLPDAGHWLIGEPWRRDTADRIAALLPALIQATADADATPDPSGAGR
ncbi:alpha-beta hydrolase superfamily lysophospholipase [Rhodothalassium salexigens DSM 2132]|uniref:Alpha-beta hydrolase superfamily lysophospholipase n=1 Tax=Rhodothalassium salexigens DSM 2132 TaxID=1188247 RepID=A0A4R2PF78_RHOSA|nr:alpha/beta hydrolase [Rhodothalassium salexigens]MBB4211749.1 pimeloyl-ACP methyl ester carboxylesterase [Rhodothalassium salexigens DSM 2132]TCP33953.1 alpha-beta hydrolase superfamily lysophospholipase [Rhodothalassium salexigens DSM 2132]